MEDPSLQAAFDYPALEELDPSLGMLANGL